MDNSATNKLWKKNVRFLDLEIATQKDCFPGPRATFKKGRLPFYEYIMHHKQPGSLGCGPGKYPKYNNGKYCCVTQPATNQEMLDYSNFLLEGAMKNVSDTAFMLYKKNIDFIIRYRNELISNNRWNIREPLVDNLEFPDGIKSLEDWYNKMELESSQISRDRPDPTLGGKLVKRRKGKSHKKIVKKGKKSRKNRK